MNIGELFVNIGVKGAEKTIGALSGIKSGMGSLADVSLEAKAAIVAAIYAFERLMSSSAAAGTKLENFTALTGISNRTLQEYQYAARQVGVSNEDVAGSFKSVQKAMTSMIRLGQGAPAGLQLLQQKVQFDPVRAEKDISYAMKQFQEYALKEKDAGLRNFVLGSFGLGEGFISGLARNAFRPDAFKKAPTYSAGEITQLDKARAAWSNLGTTIEMAIGHFNSKHGVQLVNDLSKLVGEVVKLTEAFLKLAQTLHLFEGIGKVLGGFTHVLGAVGGGAGKVVQGIESGKQAFDHPEKRQALLSQVKDLIFGPQSPGPHQVAPILSSPQNTNSKVQNNNVTQNFHFQHDGSDHKQVGDEVQRAVTKAYFQTPQGGY